MTITKRKTVNGYLRTLLVVLIIASAGWTSCRAPEKIYTASKAPVPEKFNATSDTTGNVPDLRSRFFADTNLAALMEKAIENNFDVQVAAQKVDMARNNVLLNRGFLAPSVGINSFASNTKYGRHTMDGAGNATTPEVPSPIVPSYMVGVSSTWEVDIWGKLRNRKKAAQLRYLSSESGRNLVITALLSELAYRYYELVSLDDEIRIINRNIALQESALEIVRVQKSVGKATELAVKQFSAQLLHTRSLAYRAEQQIVRVSNEIGMLSASYDAGIRRNTSIFDQSLPDMVRIGVPSSLLNNRPDIIQAALELEATKADVHAARAALLPSFNISAHAGFNTYHPNLLFDPVSIAYGLVGSLSGPLVNRKFYKAGYGISLAQNKEAYYNYAKTVMNAVYEVRTTLLAIENLRQQYLIDEQEAKALTDAIAIAKDLYVAGYANYLEVITAQKNAVEAELNLVKTKKQILFAKVDLYRTLGGGWK